LVPPGDQDGWKSAVFASFVMFVCPLPSAFMT
jgi:hypothetical protein